MKNQAKTCRLFFWAGFRFVRMNQALCIYLITPTQSTFLGVLFASLSSGPDSRLKILINVKQPQLSSAQILSKMFSVDKMLTVLEYPSAPQKIIKFHTNKTR